MRTNQSSYPSHNPREVTKPCRKDRLDLEEAQEEKSRLPCKPWENAQNVLVYLPWGSQPHTLGFSVERCSLRWKCCPHLRLSTSETGRFQLEPNPAIMKRVETKRSLNLIHSLCLFLFFRSNNIQAGACFSVRSRPEMFLKQLNWKFMLEALNYSCFTIVQSHHRQGTLKGQIELSKHQAGPGVWPCRGPHLPGSSGPGKWVCGDKRERPLPLDHCGGMQLA